MSRELYDEICARLTDYENPNDYTSREEYEEVDWADEFYKLLVEVVNNSEYA